jgi:hypothetical protein
LKNKFTSHPTITVSRAWLLFLKGGLNIDKGGVKKGLSKHSPARTALNIIPSKEGILTETKVSEKKTKKQEPKKEGIQTVFDEAKADLDNLSSLKAVHFKKKPLAVWGQGLIKGRNFMGEKIKKPII